MRCGVVAMTGAVRSVVKWNSASEAAVRSFVPALDFAAHKGAGGRVAVIGGSLEYTGAPYYAAASALHCGADLSWVFCADAAATAIKAYSPELIVIPCYAAAATDEEVEAQMVRTLDEWLPRLQGLIIGPGLGRRPGVVRGAQRVLESANARGMPVVVDADGLFAVTQRLDDVVRGRPNLVITPNAAEFARLERGVLGGGGDSSSSVTLGVGDDDDDDEARLQRVCADLGGVIVVRKGRVDLISDGSSVLACDEAPSPRRCGGLGDLLSGAAVVLAVWASRVAAHRPPECGAVDPRLWAAYAACVCTRRAAREAFDVKKRSMTAPDALDRMGSALEAMAPTVVVDSATTPGAPSSSSSSSSS